MSIKQSCVNVRSTNAVCAILSGSGRISVDLFLFFFFQAEDGIRDLYVTGVQTCALPILCLQRSERRLVSGQSRRMASTRLLTCQRRSSAAMALSESNAVRKALTQRPCGRSEERRVGKECRSRWSPEEAKKKEQSGVSRHE